MEKKDEIITRLEETLGEIRREDALWRLSPNSSEGKAAYEDLKREAFRNTSRLYYLLDQATDKESARRIEQEAYLYLSSYRNPPDETPEGLINRTFVTNEPPTISSFQRICKWLSDIFNAGAALGDPTVADKPVVARGFLLLLDQPKSPRRGARMPLFAAPFTHYEQDLIEEAFRGLYEVMLNWAQSLKGVNQPDLARRILSVDPQTYVRNGGLFCMVGNRFGPFFQAKAIARLFGRVDPRYGHVLLREYDGRYERLLEEVCCLSRLPNSDYVHEQLFRVVCLYLLKSISGHFDRNVLTEPGFRVGVCALSRIWSDGLKFGLKTSGAAEFISCLEEYLNRCRLTALLGVAFPERHKRALVEINRLINSKEGKSLTDLFPVLERVLQDAFGTPAMPTIAVKEEKFAAEADRLNELLTKNIRFTEPNDTGYSQSELTRLAWSQAYQHFLNVLIGPEAEYMAEAENSSTAKESVGNRQMSEVSDKVLEKLLPPILEIAKTTKKTASTGEKTFAAVDEIKRGLHLDDSDFKWSECKVFTPRFLCDDSLENIKDKRHTGHLDYPEIRSYLNLPEKARMVIAELLEASSHKSPDEWWVKSVIKKGKFKGESYSGAFGPNLPAAHRFKRDQIETGNNNSHKGDWRIVPNEDFPEHYRKKHPKVDALKGS